jgi:APA family basic amino acid/polyamine antiporter
VAIGAVIALFNGLSSAQLAANHPVSGGTYEYGYRYLNPRLGFVAGWMFLLAKSASAATAALGFAGYLLLALDLNTDWQIPLALAAVGTVTTVVIGGVRRSNKANIAVVSITLFTLVIFVLAGLAIGLDGDNFSPFFADEDVSGSALQNTLYASALMFVAYTGYGRIATLSEEVHTPRRTIPRAIISTLIVTMFLYGSVALVGVGTVGTDVLSSGIDEAAAPLEVAARSFSFGPAPTIMAVGAITAMLGVLLNLILGLSRVLLAMGRRGDMPAITGRIDAAGTTPYVAVVVMGGVIAGLVLIGNVKTTWTFSAFTVLIYYALTNLAALQLSPDERLFPRWMAFCGLIGCLFLAFWVPVAVWLAGLALIVVGLIWQAIFARIAVSG